MAFVSLDSADLEAGKPVDESLMDQIKDNFDALNADIGTLSTGNIPNGDMEIDTDSDDTPDSWSVTLYPGGAQTLETTNPLNGTQSLKFIHPGGAGNGGGYAESDYLTCGSPSKFNLAWLMQSSVVGIYNIVLVRWFDEDKVYLSSTTCYASTTNSTSAGAYHSVLLPPSGAKFYKIRVVGGDSSVNVAGTVLFDDVRVNGYHERTQVVSSSVSSVEFTNIPYDATTLQLQYEEAVTSVVSGPIGVQFSTNNGATWVTTGYSYSGTSGASSIRISPAGVSSTALGFGVIIFSGLNSGAPAKITGGDSSRVDSSGVYLNSIGVLGSSTVTSRVTALRIVKMSGGTITNGTFTLRAI